jgi:hypothetical protein
VTEFVGVSGFFVRQAQRLSPLSGAGMR